MAENKERLFDQFPQTSYQEWRAKVEADLKGADFNKKLVWRTNEGFDVQLRWKPQKASPASSPTFVAPATITTGSPART